MSAPNMGPDPVQVGRTNSFHILVLIYMAWSPSLGPGNPVPLFGGFLGWPSGDRSITITQDLYRFKLPVLETRALSHMLLCPEKAGRPL